MIPTSGAVCCRDVALRLRFIPIHKFTAQKDIL